VVEGQADPASDISSTPRPVGLVGRLVAGAKVFIAAIKQPDGTLQGRAVAGRSGWSNAADVIAARASATSLE
jgi:hypothetical protein